MKQLIVNADDFGIHHEVNQAVYMAFHKGILTSTSLMAGGRAFSEAAGMALAMPRLGTGVHLTLVGGLPTVLPAREVPSLTWEEGHLCRSYKELLERDMKGLIRREDVYREWDGQIRKILDAGISITHMDGHQHLHMWPRFFPIALSLAVQYHIPCMRVPAESLSFGAGFSSPLRMASRDVLTVLSRRNRKKLVQAGILSNDWFWGMICGGRLTEKRVLQIAGKLRDGTSEIMCHPSADEAVMEECFHWGYHGSRELEALLSPEVMNAVREKKIRLISYRDLAEEQQAGEY